MARRRNKVDRYWWDDRRVRPVWVEITRRPNDDIGVDLNHDNGRTFPLLEAARKGDRVLHWDSKRGCFVGCSQISDTRVDVRGESRFRYLTGFVQFSEGAITLDSLRRNYRSIREARAKLASQVRHNQSLLFPFAPYAKTWKRLQPQLNYLTAAPTELLAVLGAIYESHRKGSSLYCSWRSLGLGSASIKVAVLEPTLNYDRANELITIDDSGVRVPNTKELEKSARAHSRLQNQAADWLHAHGYVAVGNQPLDPLPVDIQWRMGPVLVVAEVKSLKKSNQVAQLRRGIGQVLHYRKLFEEENRDGVRKIEAALIVSNEPDTIWINLCAELGIRLAWPGKYSNLTRTRD